MEIQVNQKELNYFSKKDKIKSILEGYKIGYDSETLDFLINECPYSPKALSQSMDMIRKYFPGEQIKLNIQENSKIIFLDTKSDNSPLEDLEAFKEIERKLHPTYSKIVPIFSY